MQTLTPPSGTAAGEPAAPPSPPRPLRVLVTGGGTGGHTTPAVATIQALRTMAGGEGNRDEQAVTFAYLGSRSGMEGEVAGGMGVEFIGIETGKLRRSRSIAGLLSRANVVDLLRVPIGYAQALGAVRRLRPDVVLSTGGYVSVPGVLAAAALRVPIVAHEQTVQIGLANRINFRFAAAIAVSVPETLDILPLKQRRRATVTGNPVREIIFGGDPVRAAAEFGFAADGTLPTVYVTGGAQGSRLLNHAVGAALPMLLERCRIVHQCGSQEDFDALTSRRAQLPELLRRRYAVRRFIAGEIGDVYALSDLIVGRSGAGTVAEACALGKPCVFVPLVPTGGDEQTRNARRLAVAGAARIVRQDDLTPGTLTGAVLPLLADPDQLRLMGQAAQSFATPSASRDLAELVTTMAIESGR